MQGLVPPRERLLIMGTSRPEPSVDSIQGLGPLSEHLRGFCGSSESSNRGCVLEMSFVPVEALRIVISKSVE